MPTALHRQSFDRVAAPLKSFGVALAVALVGAVAGLASAALAPPVFRLVAPPESPLGRVLFDHLVQPGMGVFAAGYVWWRWRGDPDRVLRLRRPSLEGVAWIVLGPAAYEALVRVVRVGVLAAGLEAGGHGARPATWEVLLANPAVALPALAVLFLVMAPMEEFLYRGVVHAELADGFGVATRVVLGAALFGLMHLFLSGGLSSLLLTWAGGLVFAAAYERTDTLLVPAAIHALYWLAT